jgi:hypothetical protein
VGGVGKLEEGLTRICTDDTDFETDNDMLGFGEATR